MLGYETRMLNACVENIMPKVYRRNTYKTESNLAYNECESGNISCFGVMEGRAV